MPESHRRHAAWTPARIIIWAKQTGPATARLADAVLAEPSPPRTGLPHVPGHHPPRRALRQRPPGGGLAARAVALRSYSYRSVESILRNGLDGQPLPAERPQVPPHPAHDNLRGPGYYH